MNVQKQRGQGVAGFVFGLLIATVAIGMLLFFLNRSGKQDFKEPERKEIPLPEVLTPDQASTPQMEIASAASDVYTVTLPTASEVAPTVDASTVESKPATVVTKPKSTVSKPTTEVKKESVKPTPEQILDSGNIEKARKEAAAERKKAETALSGNADKPTAETKAAGKAENQDSRRYVVQAGAYDNRQSAETQRAKLAMLGVNTVIAEAKVNGKLYYRVQTSRLSREAADGVRRTLDKNGVSNLTRPSK